MTISFKSAAQKYSHNTFLFPYVRIFIFAQKWTKKFEGADFKYDSSHFINFDKFDGTHFKYDKSFSN